MKQKFYLGLPVLVWLLIASNSLFSQTEGASFTLTGMGVATPFASDYQALGINPGNLGLPNRYDRKVTFGIMEGGVSFFSEALSKTEVRQNIFRQKIKEFDREQKKEYAQIFANSKNSIDVDMTTLGFSIKTAKAGTFAISNRERIDFYSKMGPQVSDLMWLGFNSSYFDSLIVANSNGTFDTIPNSTNIDPQTAAHIIKGITALQNAQNISELIQGTSFQFSWMQEINLGWGIRVLNRENFQLHGGLGAKFLLGRGMTQINAHNNTTDVYSALSPLFSIDYDKISNGNPSALPSNAGKLAPVGRGLGIDLGATAVLHNRFILSAAVTDMGSITWNGNLYTLKDIKLTSFENDGMESVDFYEQIKNINGSDAVLNWNGAEARTTKLPSTFRAGFAYDNQKNLRAGIDVITPMSDDLANIEKAVIAIGGEFSPIPQIHLQAGYVQGGNYDIKIPIGIYFTLGEGSYELGVSSRDLVTFFRNNQPTISMAFGFMRFRI